VDVFPLKAKKVLGEGKFSHQTKKKGIEKMKWFLYALAGFCGGFVGGMGMGGGTLLIPLLTLLLGFSQKQAQAINLVAFLPMAAVALVIHAKKRRVRFREAIWFLPSGVIVGTLGALIMRSFSGRVLRKSFGAFLVLLALVSVIRRLKTPPKRSFYAPPKRSPYAPPKRSPYAPPKRSSHAPPKRSSYSPRKAHRCAAQKDGEASAKQR
jgi:uncharacterized membrane protein YfcA